MHVRMGSARLADSLKEVVAQAIANPSEAERKSYRCWYCTDIPVIFVKGRKEADKVLIRPHFRRDTNAPEHLPTCGFALDVRLARWKSRAIDIVTNTEKRCVLRLDHLVPDYKNPAASRSPSAGGIPARQNAEQTVPDKAPGADGPAPLPRAQQQQLQRVTCQAVRELWRLSQLVDRETGLHKRVLLRLGNRSIDWQEFFFRHDVPGDLDRLASIVQRFDEVPICLLGRVHQIRYDVTPTSKKDPYHRIDLKWARLSGGSRFAVMIATHHRSILSSYKSGDEVVVCGKLMRLPESTAFRPRQDKLNAWCWLKVEAQIGLRDDSLAAIPDVDTLPTLGSGPAADT